ncbi:MAG: RluA family pseudouridine synthase [Fervidobacterium sp.]
MVKDNQLRWIINEDNYFSRVDKFLRKALKNVPLSAIYKFLRTGKVLVNGKKIKQPSTKLNIGDIVEVINEEIENYKRNYTDLRPAKLDLEIIYEDEKIISVNKPAGLSVHPGKNVNKPSLIEGLMHYGQTNGFEPFLVHRLDKETSGVLIVAKNRNTARILSEIISSRNVEKIYSALVFGKIEQITIDELVDGQEAVSHVKPIEYFKIKLGNEITELTHVDVEIETGRKHQIRKHLSSVGFPIVCDKDYGNFKLNREFSKRYSLKRQFLHCSRMIFEFEGKTYDISAKISDDLLNTLRLLKMESGKN